MTEATEYVLTRLNARNADYVSAVDLSKEMLSTALPQGIERCIKKHKNWKDPYYILVHFSRHADAPEKIKIRYWARQTRPKPDYDTTLYRYVPSAGDVEYCWTVPDKIAVDKLLRSAEEIDSSEHQLLYFAKKFMDGSLE